MSSGSSPSQPSNLEFTHDLKDLPPNALSYTNDLRRRVHSLERSLANTNDATRVRESECRNHCRQLDDFNDRLEEMSFRMVSLKTELLQAYATLSRKDSELRCIHAERDREIELLRSQFDKDVEFLKNEVQVWFRHYLDVKHPVSLVTPSPSQYSPINNMFEVPMSGLDFPSSSQGVGPPRP